MLCTCVCDPTHTPHKILPFTPPFTTSHPATGDTKTSDHRSPMTTQPVQTESTHPHPTQPIQPESTHPSSSPPKRTKSPVVRIVGSRIYDPKNGKTCHQCRQKTMDVSVKCTNESGNKTCPLNVCRACLLNRYGENVEEAAASGEWKCPRCRGICNCSSCMKKRGFVPTGPLIHTAKKVGFASVSNLLNMTGSVETEAVKRGARKKRRADDKETGDEPERKLTKEDGESEETGDEPERKRMKEDGESESCQEEKSSIEDTSEDNDVKLQLPQGTELTNLAGIDLPSGDVGHALQLLEFCETFGEVLQLKNGEPEILLRELTCANAHKTPESLTVQIHTRLLSIIEEGFGKKYSGTSWVEDFKECISESQYLSKDPLLECFNSQPNGYDELNFSKKLRLLNFLCDEALGTAKLRLWIEERNVEEKKMAKERLIANREKEKNLKKKVHDEVVKAILSPNRTPLTISEQKDLVSKVKAETAQILANSMEMRDIPRESYVVRSEPILLDINGCKLWKLRSHYDKVGILRQDSCYEDVMTPDEKWFAYNDQEKALVDEYISNSRNIRE
ncbi:putative transcription factor & chromatin remodeling DDT family [Helianthus annuus]|uniref:Transcription factor & chromatin remodeling DDT family n=2 Tax=Helianthus annuus TaxID=4232 RepID=A0A9K3J1A8_HELAN|nr:putative transcription factor & chromatin remodeling DDT family [Helianthus annuus]KAJ0585221.1 putative transcription factor & chromatin remodeling DDT family [Helianthus annuus]KAJ0919706.1 putative transcription factor & chromatin remodeling DDT family [Helianthus annuus]